MVMMGPQLERSFREFDIDNSGTLDMCELKAAFKSAGRPCTEARLKKLMGMLDTNGDGVLDLQEFKAIAWHNEVISA